MTRTLAGILALCLVMDVSAQCRVVTVRRPATIVTPIVHDQQAIVAVPITIPVVIPATVFQYMPALQPVPTQPAVPVHQQPPAATPVSADPGPPPLILPNQAPALSQTPVEDVTAQVANMLGSRSCVQCHTAGGTTRVQGNTTLFTQTGNDLFFQPSVSRQLIHSVVSGPTPRMPPSAAGNPAHPTALRPEDIALLQRWITAR